MEASNGEGRPTAQPVGEMFNQVGEEIGQFLGREFARLREEASERARAGAKGAGLLTAAGFSGSIAVAAALALPLIALRRLIGPAGTSVVVATSAGALAAYLAKRGLDELGVPTEETAERESADLGTVGATARQLERALHIDHERLRAELDVPVAHVVVE